MPETAFFHISSGDVVADRRFTYACDLRGRGDLAAAADLLEQAIELAPGFASAWFALGEVRAGLGDAPAAVAAFRAALAADPADRHGASLHLMRLGAAPEGAMPEAYVRAVFDQYAANFDAALVDRLGYRGPRLLRDAVAAACAATGRIARFSRGLDLGCGTGLSGEAFAGMVAEMDGVDLSPKMVARAKARGCYRRLQIGDMLGFMRGEESAGADLVIAADAFVYLSELAPICREAARVLRPSGLLAFSVEAHEDGDGKGIRLGRALRYACDATIVREAIAAAGLALAALDAVSTRAEAGIPVPGLIAVAIKA
jgi:predicted TPR repeat methyltransferase